MAKRRKIWAWVYAVFITIYVVVLSGIALFLLSKVWDYAEEYEAARPEPVIEAYVANLRENLWDESIEETISAMPHEAQSNADVAEIVKDMLSNDISYSRQASTGGSSSIVYNLRCGDRVFGQVTLIEDQSKKRDVKYDMLPWTIGKEEFDFTGLYSSVEITVPEMYTVELNGWEVTDEYIVEKGIHYDVLEGYYEAYPTLPTKVTYRFEDVLGKLDPVVLDEDGNVVVIDETKDDSQFIHMMEEGAQLTRLKEFADNFTERYRRYITGISDPNYGYQTLAVYMQLGSDIDVRMKAAMDGLTWAHTVSFEMEWVELNYAIDLGDGFYILNISSQAKTYHEYQGYNYNLQTMEVIVTDVGNDIRAVTYKITRDEDIEQ